jgi:predicted ATP-grasp superfamily ATP-dependent carboligase
MTERTTLPLSARRAALAAVAGRIVLPPHETVLRAYDKSQTTALAASLGVVVPRTELLVTPAEAGDFAARAAFPVVLKPASSEELGANGTRTTGAPCYARTADELPAAFADVRARASAVLAQEYIEGGGAGYFALMHHGQLRAEFAHRRIRDVRPSGSGSALRASVLPDPAVREASLKVLGALGWHGVAMVEFRVRPDGTPVFLEVNGRFWNSLALAVYAGVDFPALLAAMAEQGDVPRAPAYREGITCRWLLGDVRHLVAVWAGAPSGYTGRWPGRLSTLASFLVPVRGTFHDNFTLDDPLPELGDWLDFVGRKVPRLLRSRA